MAATKETQSGTNWGMVALGVVVALVGVYLANAHVFSSVEGPLQDLGIPLDLGASVATIGMFIALFPVIKSFFVTPLHDAIQNRTSELERTFSEAESLRAEMTQMRGDYERRLIETENDARQRIQAQINEAQALRQTLMAEATQRADELVARAQQEIESEKAKVIIELRTQVVDLALAAAEKVMGENMDDARNRRLVEDFVNRVEVAR